MTRDKIQALINEFCDNSPLNYLGAKGASEEDVLANNYAKHNLYHRGITADMLGADEDSGLMGMRFFQRPIFAIARADDPGFKEIQRPEVVGPHHLLPEDWLSGAKSVISFFLPYERATVEANKKDPVEPAIEWIYTRVDGQRFLLALGAKIRDALIEAGYRAVAPYCDDRYIMQVNRNAAPGTEHVPPFSTNWSERHVAVVTGLGTFGMSTNFISKAGCAGRLVSVVTDWETEPDERDYDHWLGYCNSCGACVRRCPAQAHYTDRHGKDHEKCGAFIRKVCEKFAPRYGCGKCQSGVPCEYKPMRAKG
ncbi:MAG: epoxyqueuosine reductase [Clostridiales bacterium]|nr:epoxyqueuosine reductase [Clostridiales bacterium]